MNNMSVQKPRKLSESGMASFLVTMIMMIVITLLVLGFSQVVRSNSREALDRQLSTQAFYAAESGINVTQSAMQSYLSQPGNTAGSMIPKSTCAGNYDPAKPNGLSADTNVQLAPGVRYTCVLVTAVTNNLQYKNQVTDTGESLVAPITASGTLNTLKFTWTKQSKPQSAGAETCTDTVSKFDMPRQLNWGQNWNCGFGLLRVDLFDAHGMDLAGPATYSDTDLSARTTTIFMTPHGNNSGGMGGTPFSINFSQKTYLAPAKCAAQCQMVITLLGDSSTYYARITSLYRQVPLLTIDGTSGGADANFTGEPIVDVTGQAQDELRRVQVRIQTQPTINPGSVPDFAVSSSNSICKHFSIVPGKKVNANNLCQD